MKSYLIPIFAFTLLCACLKAYAETGDARTLMDKIALTEDADERALIYLEISKYENKEVLVDLKKAILSEKESRPLLSALYADLRMKFSNDQTISRIFRIYDGDTLDRSAFLQLFTRKKASYSAFFNDVDDVTEEMLPSTRLLKIIKNRNEDARLRAAALMIAGSRSKKYLLIAMKNEIYEIPTNGPSLPQAMTILALFERHNDDFYQYYYKLTDEHNYDRLIDYYLDHSNGPVNNCQTILVGGKASNEDVFDVIQYHLSKIAEKYSVDSSDVDISRNYATDKNYLGGCVIDITRWGDDARTIMDMYFQYLTDAQRKKVLMQMLVLFGDSEQISEILEEIKKEYGKGYLNAIAIQAKRVRSNSGKLSLDNALAELASREKESRHGGDGNGKMEIQNIRKKLGLTSVFKFTYDGYYENQQETINFNKALFVKGACLSERGEGDRFGMFLQYIPCKKNLIHLEYVYDLENVVDEEWFLVVDFQGDFKIGDEIVLKDLDRANLFYSHMGPLAPAFDSKGYDGRIVMTVDGENLLFTADFTFSGMRRDWKRDGYVKSFASIKGKGELTPVSFEEFYSSAKKDIDKTTGADRSLEGLDEQLMKDLHIKQ